MITDQNKGITNISYNHLNLPTQVTLGGQNINYVYDASGVKLRKTVQGVTTDYAGNYIYENNTLQFFSHPEGYVKKDGSAFNYVYQYKDHLGNIRLSYTDKNQNNPNPANIEIIQESNYYPFGLKHKGYNNVVSSNGNSIAQKFGFGGKELSEELGLQWHDFGARNYDASLGRWMNIDPLAEDYLMYSTYNYTLNNPIIFVDPDGRSPILGAILGAFTEYAGIIGSKMLFDNKTFSEANNDLNGDDAINIAVGGGFGVITGAFDGGISKFATWASKSRNRKILKLLFDAGISAVEGSLKTYLKDDEFDLKEILTGALAEAGLGSLLEIKTFKKAAKTASNNSKSASRRAEDLAKRRKPNSKLIEKAKNTAIGYKKTEKTMNKMNNIGVSINKSTSKAIGNKVQKVIKEKKEDNE